MPVVRSVQQGGMHRHARRSHAKSSLSHCCPNWTRAAGPQALKSGENEQDVGMLRTRPPGMLSNLVSERELRGRVRNGGLEGMIEPGPQVTMREQIHAQQGDEIG